MGGTERAAPGTDDDVYDKTAHTVARTLGRTTRTIRRWVASGVIPAAPLRTASGKQLWCGRDIRVLTQAAADVGLLADHHLDPAVAGLRDRVDQLYREIG
jgi:hypothetical protein